MAKQSMKNRELKRQQTVAKFAQKRAALKAIIANPESSPEARWEAQVALQKQPRDASTRGCVWCEAGSAWHAEWVGDACGDRCW